MQKPIAVAIKLISCIKKFVKLSGCNYKNF